MKYIFKFLKDFNFQIDQAEWDLNYYSHPNFPHIYAIADTLEYFNVESIVAQIPKESFDDLPNVFLSIIIKDGKQEIVYTNKQKLNQITVVYDNEQKEKYDKSTFLKIWTGILLSIEENKKKDKSLNLKINKVTLLLLAWTLLLIGFSTLIYKVKIFDIISIGYFFISALGLIVSTLTLKESLGFDSNKFNQLCSSIPNGDCNEIIFSKGSEIIYGISLSDLSFIYFIFSCINSFFLVLFDTYILLQGMSLISLFFVSYSIYYQHYIAKNWCLPCLGTSLILVCQFVYLTIINEFIFQIEVLSVLISLIIFSLCFLGWTSIKPFIEKYSAYESIKYDFYKTLRTNQVLNTILQQENRIKINYSKSPVLYLNANAINQDKEKLIIILSPNCDGCHKAYLVFRDFFLRHSRKFNCGIIFKINEDLLDSETFQVFNRLIDIHFSSSNQIFLEALNDWFVKRINKKEWLKKWNLAKRQTNILNKFKGFLEMNKIYNSPTTIKGKLIIPTNVPLDILPYFTPKHHKTKN